jgi:hypothetical protein
MATLLPPKEMAQTHLCKPFVVGVDGGAAFQKALKNSCLIFLIHIEKSYTLCHAM